MIGQAVVPVYLIHWDAPEWCASAVASVRASKGIEVDIAVIDNGQQRPPALRGCLGDASRVIETGRNAGYTGGANAAFRDWRERHPDAQLAVIASHDLQVEPYTLALLAATAEQHPEAGIVAPLLTAPNRRAGGVWTGTRSAQVALQGDERGVVERDWASGTCLLLRRACVDDLGDFDERFGSYMEDVDYGLRARGRGWAVLVNIDAHASGIGSTSTNSVAAMARNTVLLAAKRGGLCGALRTLALFSFWAIRGLFTSVAPIRSAERQAVSRLYARQRFAGLASALTDGQLWSVLRDRSGRAG